MEEMDDEDSSVSFCASRLGFSLSVGRLVTGEDLDKTTGSIVMLQSSTKRKERVRAWEPTSPQSDSGELRRSENILRHGRMLFEVISYVRVAAGEGDRTLTRPDSNGDWVGFSAGKEGTGFVSRLRGRRYATGLRLHEIFVKKNGRGRRQNSRKGFWIRAIKNRRTRGGEEAEEQQQQAAAAEEEEEETPYLLLSKKSSFSPHTRSNEDRTGFRSLSDRQGKDKRRNKRKPLSDPVMDRQCGLILARSSCCVGDGSIGERGSLSRPPTRRRLSETIFYERRLNFKDFKVQSLCRLTIFATVAMVEIPSSSGARHQIREHRFCETAKTGTFRPPSPLRLEESGSCCGLAALVTSSVKPPKPRSFSTLVLFLGKASVPVSPAPASGRWRTSMLPNSRSRGAVSFSAGNTGEGGEREREILVQHLLVSEDKSKLLLELQQRISEGTDLSDLAVEYSICPSKDNGGMLGWVRKGQMVPEFEDAAFAAPLNKVVRCKSKFGWHLLQVLSEREACLLQDIEPEELHSKMQDPDFLQEAQLIDVREPEEVAQASLPGFKVLPLRQFGSWAPGIANEFDLDKDTYVLCHHGMRSLQVAKWLQSQGFRKVFNISGGIHSYALKADPSVPTY
ncbi:hypothetical protein H6P81_007854 [Aristolochia fimbriata]|uniref:Peptidylprolyl isomerase n=1 Tax=Aristolochia fimbriata TaxID=158543 RepID=A0AAV7F1E2_ARIFI|nr:hypothetical protein H6P81_007854 [Aristolochia fimbriata]